MIVMIVIFYSYSMINMDLLELALPILCLRASLWLEKSEVEMLVPRNKLLQLFVKNIAKEVVSSQATCIIIHARPSFILAIDHQISQPSRLDNDGSLSPSHPHVSP